jgi:hypothetical protein
MTDDNSFRTIRQRVRAAVAFAAASVALCAFAAAPHEGAPESVEESELGATTVENNEDGTARTEKKRLSFNLRAELASGYLSSSGTLGDTWPVTTQCLFWKNDLEEYGYFSGYFWTMSALHNKQHDRHREAFYDFETAAYYGYNWKINDDFTLCSKAGPLWNPAIGYRDGYNCSWGVHAVTSLENPYVSPYINWLGMVRPTIRERARIGLAKTYKPAEKLVLTPFVETVWMDSRRYQSRYGGLPQDRFLGGAFATTTVGFELDWKFSKDLVIFTRLRQYDVINSQSRRAVKKSKDYYAKCDWPVLGIGFEYRF